jgi:Flp pilus assembly protein TadB
MSYALKLAAAGIAFMLAGVVAVILVTNLWFRIGLGSAIVILGGALLLFAWRTDRKAREEREGLERV